MLDAPETPARTAYVTLVTKADYLPGALALIRSLNLSGTNADKIVMHGRGLSAAELAPLAQLGALMVPVDRPDFSPEFQARHDRTALHGAAPFTKGAKPVFHTPLDNFAKLRLWQLDYDRVVYLDADTIVLRNIDRLFEYPELCGAPNVYASIADFHRLNSGVFTAQPSEATYDDMIATLDQPGRFWRRTDQTFLESYFPDWRGLPVIYNTLQYVWLNLPDLWNWQTIRVLHFQYEKPWEPPHARSDSLAVLTDLWRAYHEGRAIPDLADLPRPPGCASD